MHCLSRFATSRDELVFFRLCSRRAAETSDVVGYSDCRHVCDDEESHHEDLDEGDHVHEDNDDHCSATGSEAVWSCFPVSTVQLYCIQGVLWSYGVAASSRIGLYDLVQASVISPFVRRHDVSPPSCAMLSNSSLSD